LREAVEGDPGTLERVRAGLDGLEATLWAEADELGNETSAWERFAGSASDRTTAALDALASGGLGVAAPA
jgi:hypothetical protein